MPITNADRRRDALARHVQTMSANLLRAYVLDMLDLAPPAEVDKLIVALRAQDAVPAKDAG